MPTKSMYQQEVVEQTLYAKPRKVVAVEFDGKNSRAVARWIRENSDFKATARGSYVSVHKFQICDIIMTKGDVAVKDFASGEVSIYDSSQFKAVFEILSWSTGDKDTKAVFSS